MLRNVRTAVVLHGWGVDSSYWREFARRLEEANYRVLVPDLPGFGQGKALPSSGWSVRDYANWLRRFLQEQSITSCFLIGHSFGARVAVKFSALYPEKVKKLVLIAPAGIPEKLTIRQKLAQWLARASKNVLAPGASRNTRGRRLFRRLVYRLAGVRDYFEIKNEAVRNTFLKVIKEDLSQQLTQIKAPALIIWGTHDSFVSAQAVKKIHQLIPDSRLELIKEADHALYRKQPQKISQLVVAFLSNRDN